MKTRTYQQLVRGQDFSGLRPLADNQSTVFEGYHFQNCNFMEAQLQRLDFRDCLFEGCNLSNAVVDQTGMMDIVFKDCKLMGMNIWQSKDFGFSIVCENCNMNYMSFDRKKLYKSIFRGCSMQGVNFTQADFSKATIEQCDFEEAVFMRSNLSGLDFSNSRGFLIDAEQNNLKKAKFQSQDLWRLLYKYGIEVIQ